MKRELTFTALFPFCGLGAGARGFLDASAHLFDFDLKFRCLGGLDFDQAACDDFTYLTETPAWCVDATNVTGEMLRNRYGMTSPDCVFLSPPCKGASGLLPKHLADTEKYLQMNELALVWTQSMLDAWRDDPPKLVLLENVPRLKTRGKVMLAKVKKLLRDAGYLLHEGFHDCGEIGGLAQRRRRYLLVARLKSRCPNLLYQPPKKRVRACGEVLELLPVPATPAAAALGRIHDLPKITWLNWVRLALIPPGGDWRDLAGVLAEGQARREVFKRHEVAQWTEPVGTVTGAGANSVGHVADPRIDGMNWFGGVLGVQSWDGPASTVTGRAGVSTGSFAVADPRDLADPSVRHAYDAGYAVLGWDQAARTIAGTTAVGCGAYAVAEPRPGPPFNVQVEEALRLAAAAPMKPPPFLPVITSKDGSWHRPLTTLELASLQGLPTMWRGAPLQLAGKSQSSWRERIGNAVPVGAAKAIAEKMLITLGASAFGSLALDGGSVWVMPRDQDVDGMQLSEVM